ncbi:hypothetical protein GCM10022206_48160 [Streptomyces chiangmaiensis]
MANLHTSEDATGTGDRSRPRAVLPALSVTQVTGWYAFRVLNPQITAPPASLSVASWTGSAHTPS